MRALVLGGFLLGSCDATGVAAIPGVVVGSRLHAWIDDGGDGAIAFVSWRDTDLDLDCEFASAADGRLRCLPLPRVATVLFADPDCTLPAVIETPEWAYVPGALDLVVQANLDTPARGGMAASWRWTVRRVGGDVPFPSGELYAPVTDSGGCGAQAPSMAYHYLALGDAVPPESFVSASFVEEPRAGGLDARVLVADDGARRVERIVIHASGSTCWPTTIGNERRCVAGPLTGDAGFADALCTIPIAMPFTGGMSLEVPTVLLRADDGGECRTRRAHAVGEPSATEYRLNPTTGGCEALPGPFPTAAWKFGPELDASALDAAAPRLTSASLGTGALRVHVIADVDGVPFYADPVAEWSTADSVRCEASFGNPGGPCELDSTGASLYADAECTSSLVQDTSVCALPTTRVAYAETTGEYRRIGERYTGSAIYARALDGSCDYLSGPVPGLFLRRVGAVVTPSLFPRVRRLL
jgi:hypothetical protein